MTTVGDEYRSGQRVEYNAAPVYDGIIETGDIGLVTRVEDGWVFAKWRDGIHSVPLRNVRTPVSAVERLILVAPEAPIWPLVGEARPPVPGGRPRDPYYEEDCHPDCVERVWVGLGNVLPANCRAQANGTPVLAHPRSDEIFASARGTSYALRLVADDFADAMALGAKTVMTSSGGHSLDLSGCGPGWIWGAGYEQEQHWILRTYQAASRVSPARTS
jgi:hypothetical protein